jgi:hypothetical protein
MRRLILSKYLWQQGVREITSTLDQNSNNKMFKSKLTLCVLAVVVLMIILSGIKYYYFDNYLMSLNGKVTLIRTDIKQAMYVTVGDKEYNFAHFWPTFQKHAETGDIVYKKPKEYSIILIKSKTKAKIVCAYDE